MSSILNVLEVADLHEHEKPGMPEVAWKTATSQKSSWVLCTHKAITTTTEWALMPQGN